MRVSLSSFFMQRKRGQSYQKAGLIELMFSAGLTLTSCRVVHLLEPVLKHSFELQGKLKRLIMKLS